LEWTNTFGDNDKMTSVLAVKIGSDGAVYSAGYMNGTGGQMYGFVEKMDANGNVIWLKNFDASLFSIAQALTVTSSGELLVAGQNVNEDASLTKLDSSGNLVWSRIFGSAAADEAFAVCVSPDGSVSVGGQTYGVMAGVANAGQADAFLAHFDAAG